MSVVFTGLHVYLLIGLVLFVIAANNNETFNGLLTLQSNYPQIPFAFYYIVLLVASVYAILAWPVIAVKATILAMNRINNERK